jgi:serine/threonine protein phosphatase PrpC
VAVDPVPSQWDVLVACERGASHVTDEAPIQDAAGYFGDPSVRSATVVLAVADGHGDRRHFRSAIGSDIAVAVAGDVGLQFGGVLHQSSNEAGVRTLVEAEIIPALSNRWREAVAKDAAQDPTALVEPGEAAGNLTIAYGTTMLVAILAYPWLILCQIGDGDIVFVSRDGPINRPVPDDPRLIGNQTTSLCQVDAIDSFRSAVIDMRTEPPEAIFMATDGFANAQTDQQWHQLLGQDLVRYARDNGVEWMRERLPQWAALCASGQGSGDDTSIVLLLSKSIDHVPRNTPSRAT